jgi:competence protein ComGC
VLVIACWQAFQARDIKSEFSEATYIGLAVFSMSQAFLTGIPIVAVVREIPQAFYLVLTFLIFLLCMVILLLIFLPKIFKQRAYAGMSQADQRKSMSMSAQQSSLHLSSISGLQQRACTAGMSQTDQSRVNAVSLDDLHALLRENMAPDFSDKALQMLDVILENASANVTPVAMTPHPETSGSPSPGSSI